ncbi:MAG: HEAT repeat domain-containing protein [Planctomycetes bacterium]|nr:HEAT repeat domain-containing protein [Planctomycetota bacterium]
MNNIRLLTLGMIGVLGACSAPAGEVEQLDFYEWLDLRREDYNMALNMRDYTRHMRIDAEIAEAVERRYDPLVLDSIRDPDPRKRALATFALGFSRIRRPETAARLIKLLEDRDPRVRGTAAAALGILDPEEPLPWDKFKKLLEDQDPYVRLGALFSLKLMIRPMEENPLYDSIVGFLDDRSEDLRNEAVLVLGSLRRPEGLRLLRRKLTDESSFVRINTALMIGGYESSGFEAVPALIEQLRDPDTNVVEAVAWALRRVTGREDAGRSYQSWLDWYQESLLFDYVCLNPEHQPPIVRPAAGICPICGRRLEPRSKPLPPPIGTRYGCPQHEDIVAPAPGKCPRCQAELVPLKR